MEDSVFPIFYIHNVSHFLQNFYLFPSCDMVLTVGLKRLHCAGYHRECE